MFERDWEKDNNSWSVRVCVGKREWERKRKRNKQRESE